MLLSWAHFSPLSKKRTKLQQFSDTRKKNVFFFTFFHIYLRARNIFSIFARFFDDCMHSA